MKIAIKTLGCRANRYESDIIREKLAATAVTFVDPKERADIYVINTCTVTHVGDKKSRQAIRAIKHAHPQAKTIAFGCAIRLKDNTYDTVEELDHMFKETDDVIEFIKVESEKTPTKQLPHTDIPRTRALIKVQDGCDNFCSFCIVPQTRGRAVSLKSADILEDVRTKVAHGFKEMVITGINVGTWKEGDLDFGNLMEMIMQEPGVERVRLSSIEPADFPDHFYQLFAHPKFCKQIHLCLQSGSNKTLKAMRRNYQTDLFEKVCNKLREIAPDIGITTDYIVGFPGETVEAFKESLEFCKKIQFSKMHVFKYSIRKNTLAEKLPNHVTPAEKEQRSKEALKLEEEMRHNFAKKHIGQTTDILYEADEDGFATGYTSNYIKVRIPSSGNLKNKIATTKLSGVNDEGVLTGSVL